MRGLASVISCFLDFQDEMRSERCRVHVRLTYLREVASTMGSQSDLTAK